MKKSLFTVTFFIALCTMANSEVSSEFNVKAVGHFCYQYFEEARSQALNQLFKSANNICARRIAEQISPINQYVGGCSLRLEARFVCKIP